MNCLDSEPGASRDSGGASESGEDMFDDGLHSSSLSEHRIVSNPPCYPKLLDAHSRPSWQNSDMTQEAFDRAAVAEAMKARKATQTDMAKVMGLPSQSAFSNIMKGKRRITANEARTAYQFLGLEIPATIRMIPVIGMANAGNWREAINMPLGEIAVPISAAGNDAFAIELVGDSMNMIIEEGAHIVVDPRQKELRDGKCYLIQNGNGEATVKAYSSKPARFEPRSTNPEHKGWSVSDHDFVILGRVVMKISDL